MRIKDGQFAALIPIALIVGKGTSASVKSPAFGTGYLCLRKSQLLQDAESIRSVTNIGSNHGPLTLVISGRSTNV
jgi:hypothetical protein